MSNLIFIILFITSLYSCSQEDEIIPINFSKYEKLFVPPMTQKKSNEIALRQDNEIKEKSIGKKIPPITVKDTSGNEVLLKELITQKTLISIVNAHCGFGLESVTNDLPKALEKIKNSINVIILLEKTSEDEIDASRFNRNLKDIIKLYPNVYVIDENDSHKINVYSSPVRYYFNEEGVLIHIKRGLSSVDKLYNEILTVTQSL
ncbi:MAG: hypothetical protein H6587_01925 [Flavobacteriales bacterium]|nr:hypothetical protein [Flavobacteriales bacterium]MCB9363303.1 hypothetical protein [Flavobacteriales bacterium]